MLVVRLTNIGPVTAVRIYWLRETQGLFQGAEDIKKSRGYWACCICVY